MMCYRTALAWKRGPEEVAQEGVQGWHSRCFGGFMLLSCDAGRLSAELGGWEKA